MKTKQLNIKWESADGSNHQSIELVNARPTADGEIVVAGVPETIAYLSPGDRFLGCDRRANRTYYFVERDHQPMLLGYALPDVEFTFVEQSFGVVMNVSGFAVTGDFVVLATDAGLRFLHFNGDGYDLFGEAPVLPKLAVGFAEERTYSEIVSARTLRENYSRWQGSLLPQDQTDMDKSVKAALSRLKAKACDALCCTGPMAVRAALRLSDDSLIWLPEAWIAGCRPEAPSAVASVTYDGAGAYSVGSFSLSMKAWKVALAVVDLGLGKWRSLVKSLEIYAGDPCDALGAPIYRCESSQSGAEAFSLKVSIDNSEAKAKWATAAECAKLRKIASITDLEALAVGGISTLSHVVDGTGGPLAYKTYSIDNVGVAADVRFMPWLMPYSANEVTTVSNRCFAGDVVMRLPRCPWFVAMSRLDSLTAGFAAVEVVVELAVADGTARVVESYTTDVYSLRLQPLLCYPDCRAVRMVITLTVNGKMYRLDTPLQAAPDGTMAYAMSKTDYFELSLTTVPMSFAAERLYHSEPSTLLLADAANPLQWSPCRKAYNKGVVAVVASIATGSSWLLGKHSAYLFAVDGVYLLSFDKRGCSGATLVSRRRIRSSALVTPTADGAAFIDDTGSLRRLRGSSERSTGITVADAQALGYSLGFDEVLVDRGDAILSVAADNRFFLKSLKSAAIIRQGDISLLCDGYNLYTPDRETATRLDIVAQTRAVAVPSRHRVESVVWLTAGNHVSATLSVLGENGISCHGATISQLAVNGTIGAPLFHRLPSIPVRTIRLRIEGKFLSGTTIAPCVVVCRQSQSRSLP